MKIRRSQATVRETGMGVVELMFVVALGITVAGLAVPYTRESLDYLRTASAARYMTARIGATRIEALKRSSCVGLRFQREGNDYTFTAYVDGNGNGIRAADIAAGIDTQMGSAERLSHKFSGVTFTLGAGVPDADAQSGTGTDGVRIGSSRILTMTPDGSSSTGTLYLQGTRGQFAVRVLGGTGRTRVLEYHKGKRQWITR